MTSQQLHVAMVSQVFFGPTAAERLEDVLRDARNAGAEIAVLPELPCNDWVPATPVPSERDAEPPGGPRHIMQATAARAAGIAVLGGAIVRDPDSGTRHNTALLFGDDGQLIHSYRKVHLPQEPGFYEQDHYAPGDEPPRPIDGFDLPVGIQICSDLNRPQGCQILGARGAQVVLAPRATEASTFGRWEVVIRANAITSCCYVLSVNRPAPEHGVALGGPSIVVAPDGEVIACTEDRLTIVDLDRDRVETAKRNYPGYLAVRADLYARGWTM